ncbi:tRNA (guanosine(37)-N1)-methyltransferase TrmD [Bdellovibrionota bacterium FG-2]
MEIWFLSLFPEIFSTALQSSLVGKAQEKGAVSFHFIQIRDFALDRHKTTDEPPFGGGEGMVLKADVLGAAWSSIPKKPGFKTILLTPQGVMFSQSLAKDLVKIPQLIFVCGHYEGVDERFVEACVDLEISIGDYVLTGGELPALVVADTVVRLLPGVVGNERSLSEECFEGGLLKYPVYTRPRDWESPKGKLSAPEVLLGGNHREIEKWRRAQMEKRTQVRRPDLWQAKPTK